MTTHEKKIRNWKAILRKLKERREKTMKRSEQAAKREEERSEKQEQKRRREELAFRQILKKESRKTMQLVTRFGARISSLEKKLIRIMDKYKLKI